MHNRVIDMTTHKIHLRTYNDNWYVLNTSKYLAEEEEIKLTGSATLI